MAIIGAVISICQGRAPRRGQLLADGALHVRPVGDVGRLPQDPAQVVGGQQVLDRDVALLGEGGDRGPGGGQAGGGDRVALGPDRGCRRAVGADGQRGQLGVAELARPFEGGEPAGRRSGARRGRGSPGCRAARPCWWASRSRRRSAPSRGSAGRGWCRAAAAISSRAVHSSRTAARARRPLALWIPEVRRHGSCRGGRHVVDEVLELLPGPLGLAGLLELARRSPRAARGAPRRRGRRTPATGCGSGRLRPVDGGVLLAHRLPDDRPRPGWPGPTRG